MLIFFKKRIKSFLYQMLSDIYKTEAAPVAQRFSTACSPGHDPGDPGLSPALGSLHGACFSLCISASLSLSLSVSLWINKILKKKREKKERKPHKAISWFFNRNAEGHKRMAWYIQGAKRKIPTTKNTLPNKVIIQNGRRKSFSDKQKLMKGVYHH